MSAELAIIGGTRLEELEATIERGLATFVEIGNALREIRDADLYSDWHPTFEEYCRDRWGLARRRAYQMIEAADVSKILHIPVESQARALAPLANQAAPEVVREVYAEAVSEAGAPEKVTAAQLREKVRETLPPKLDQKPKSPVGTNKHVEGVIATARELTKATQKVETDAWKMMSGTRLKQAIKSMEDAKSRLELLIEDAEKHRSKVD